MINGFADKKLERCWNEGDCAELPESIRENVLLTLTVLDAATSLDDVVHTPGCQLHKLPGPQKMIYSLTIAGPWHLVCRFENGAFGDIWLKRYEYER